jgi:ankyrin repeat protein
MQTAFLTSIQQRIPLMAKLLGTGSLFAVVLLWLTSCTATPAPAPSLPLPSAVTPTAMPRIAMPASLMPTVTPEALLPATILPTATTMVVATIDANQPKEDQGREMTERLLLAAEAGDSAAVQRHLQEGANINGRDALGRTPIMAATHGNHIETVATLIQAGADVNIRDNRLDNPFLYAGAEGLMAILPLMIDAGADTTLTNRFGGTALIPAAERGHVEIVDELLTRSDVDIDHINDLGWTALLEAIVLSDGGAAHQQIVQMLVDHGADISIADKAGITPLSHAQARGFGEIESILKAAHERNRRLIDAAAAGDVESVKQLLAQGAGVQATDETGATALIAAAYQNQTEIAKLLIDAGADVNVQDRTQQSAYLISTSDGFLDLLQMSLANGADVHSLDSYNGTGLIRAADRGHVEIIAELLKTDITIDHVNRLDWTALLEAIILGDGGPRHTEVVRLLVDAGADINLADGDGVTPLEHARRRGHKEMTAILESGG